MIAVVVALALSAAPPAQPPAKSPAAKPAVVSVRVEAAANADAATKAGADELRAAIAGRKDEFRVVKADEKPELVVRVDTAKAVPNGAAGMTGALVKGETTRPFSLAFPGDLRDLAAGLARNLRGLADEMKPKPAPAK